MLEIDDSQLRGLLTNAKDASGRTHFVADCPFCLDHGHFYIRRKTEKVNSRGQNVSFYWDCKKCLLRGGLAKLLRKVGRLDLLADLHVVRVAEPVENKLAAITSYKKKPTVPEPIELPLVTMPTGFVRAKQDPYLDGRGFTPADYERYRVGRAKVLQKHKDYIIVGIEQRGRLVGYISRLTWGSEKLEAFNEQAKAEGKLKKLRYQNSTSDFAKMLFGEDELTDETTTVILVEGIFDKSNVCNLLNLHSSPTLKCCATFGKSLSEDQLNILRRFPKIKNLIFLRDQDALNTTKKQSLDLKTEFFVLVGFFDNSAIDAGNIDEEGLLNVLENLQDPLTFSLTKVLKRKLL
jgi:hypothetical protein